MKLYKDKPTTCQVMCRIAYPYVFKARKNTIKDGSPMEYGLTCLIPKKPHAHLADPNEEITGIKAMMKAAVEEGFGSNPPKGLKYPLKDGDIGNEDEAAPFPGYWMMRVKTNAHWPDGEDKNLLVVDGRGVPIGGGYGSGDWGKVKVVFKSFNKDINKGVAAYLDGVQFLYKDEQIGSSGETTPDEFDVVDDSYANNSVGADPFENE